MKLEGYDYATNPALCPRRSINLERKRHGEPPTCKELLRSACSAYARNELFQNTLLDYDRVVFFVSLLTPW